LQFFRISRYDHPPQFSGEMAQMEESEFWKNEPEVRIERDRENYAIGLFFYPRRANAAPGPLQRLVARISSTLFVIRSTLPADVLRVIQPPVPERATAVAAPEASGRPPATAVALDRNAKDLRARLHTSVETLAAIARLGWEQCEVSAATAALEQFRTDFAARETSAIWARQLRESGVGAALIIAVLLALHFGLQYYGVVLGQFQNIVLVAVGAPIGFWLSYVIAPKPSASFDGLPALQLEQRASLVGLIFVLLIAVTVGILLVSKIVTISIGSFSTDIGGSDQGASAVLIGMLCGFFRPAVLTARASDFVEALEAERRDPRSAELSHRVEDFLSDLPQRAADVFKGEAGQVLTRTMTHSVSQAIDSGLADLPDRTAEALTSSSGLKRSLQESLRAVLEPPEPVKYQGHAVIKIATMADGVDLITAKEGKPSVELATPGEYRLCIYFEAFDAISQSNAEIPLMIDQGTKAADVPFELRIDMAMSREPRRRQNVMVPALGRSQDFEFRFTLNDPKEIEADYPISITVYQHALRWGTCLVSVSAPAAA
jgi:hypothetical protein